MSFDYYYGEQSESFRFLRVSRLLFTAPQFRGLSTDAKLRYSLMLDRMCLSARNGWDDEQGRVFIYYTVTDIAEHLNCKKDKVLKLLNELDDKKGVGLMERIRQGQGNRPKSMSNSLPCKSVRSRPIILSAVEVKTVQTQQS